MTMKSPLPWMYYEFTFWEDDRINLLRPNTYGLLHRFVTRCFQAGEFLDHPTTLRAIARTSDKHLSEWVKDLRESGIFEIKDGMWRCPYADALREDADNRLMEKKQGAPSVTPQASPWLPVTLPQVAPSLACNLNDINATVPRVQHLNSKEGDRLPVPGGAPSTGQTLLSSTGLQGPPAPLVAGFGKPWLIEGWTSLGSVSTALALMDLYNAFCSLPEMKGKHGPILSKEDKAELQDRVVQKIDQDPCFTTKVQLVMYNLHSHPSRNFKFRFATIIDHGIILDDKAGPALIKVAGKKAEGLPCMVWDPTHETSFPALVSGFAKGKKMDAVWVPCDEAGKPTSTYDQPVPGWTCNWESKYPIKNPKKAQSPSHKEDFTAEPEAPVEEEGQGQGFTEFGSEYPCRPTLQPYRRPDGSWRMPDLLEQALGQWGADTYVPTPPPSPLPPSPPPIPVEKPKVERRPPPEPKPRPRDWDKPSPAPRPVPKPLSPQPKSQTAPAPIPQEVLDRLKAWQ